MVAAWWLAMWEDVRTRAGLSATRQQAACWSDPAPKPCPRAARCQRGTPTCIRVFAADQHRQHRQEQHGEDAEPQAEGRACGRRGQRAVNAAAAAAGAVGKPRRWDPRRSGGGFETTTTWCTRGGHSAGGPRATLAIAAARSTLECLTGGPTHLGRLPFSLASSTGAGRRDPRREGSKGCCDGRPEQALIKGRNCGSDTTEHKRQASEETPGASAASAAPAPHWPAAPTRIAKCSKPPGSSALAPPSHAATQPAPPPTAPVLASARRPARQLFRCLSYQPWRPLGGATLSLPEARPLACGPPCRPVLPACSSNWRLRRAAGSMPAAATCTLQAAVGCRQRSRRRAALPPPLPRAGVPVAFCSRSAAWV